MQSENLDARGVYRRLHLLPSAPPELVRDVYDGLRRRIQADGRDARAELDELGRAYEAAAAQRPYQAAESRSVPRSPWELLHLNRDAPSGIVDVAYRFWLRSHDDWPKLSVASVADAATELLTVRAPDMLERPTVARVTPTPPEDVRVRLKAAVRLVLEAGAARPVEVTPGEQPLRLGTDPTCDVVVDKRKGRAEARVWCQEGRVLFHAAAGLIEVNGRSAAWTKLDNGDIVRVGDATFRVER